MPRLHERVLSAAAVALLALCTGSLAACPGSGEGVPDKSLGNLVVKPDDQPSGIDVGRAIGDVDELLRAVSQPHAVVARALGSHRVRTTSTVTVYDGQVTDDRPISDALEHLEVTVAIDFKSPDEFRAVLENSKDYGREVVFTGGRLHLAERYGLFHRREPDRADEPARIRDEMFGELAAQLELLRGGLELGPVENREQAGRSAARIPISRAATPRQLPPETVSQRAWRDSIEVLAASGEVVLDRDSGAPLLARIRGRITATRQGRALTMVVAVDHAVSDIGQAIAVESPPEDRVVDTPVRQREVEERNQLLRGIAPPVRKSASPEGANMNPTAAPGAAGAAPREEP